MKRFMSPRELVEYIGISLSPQAKWRMDGKLPYIKIGRIVLYDRLEIEKWLENHKLGLR